MIIILSAWQSLKSVVTNFPGNYWRAEYEKEIKELQKSFRHLEARMSVKLHFLRSHLDIFQITLEIWVKSKVSAFAKALPLW